MIPSHPIKMSTTQKRMRLTITKKRIHIVQHWNLRASFKVNRTIISFNPVAKSLKTNRWKKYIILPVIRSVYMFSCEITIFGVVFYHFILLSFDFKSSNKCKKLVYNFRCTCSSLINLVSLKFLQNALAVIDMRDMEQLAEMVLNGDGQFLVGTKSDQPEIQAFLDNVPVYMVC